MTWRPMGDQGDESSKIRWELVPFFSGRVLDLGCGHWKTFPHFIGVDNGHHWGKAGADLIVDSCEKLDLIASQSCDMVFSSHLLEHIQDYKSALKEWWRVVKPGGHLCLYLPHKDFYPNISGQKEWEEWYEVNGKDYPNIDASIEAFVEKRKQNSIVKTIGYLYSGTPYRNYDHKHDFSPKDIIDAMTEFGGWDLVENQERDNDDEYSFFQAYKKTNVKYTTLSWLDKKPEKTCAIVRYGAFGDMAQTSSLFPALKSEGYHITLYCQKGGYDVVKHDPNIDKFIIQGKDEVPPQFLQEFWDYTKKKYDKWINLCESVEATLLASPGRVQWEWPNEVRAKYLDRNYLEWTHELAQVPGPYKTHFYSTVEEKAWARKTANWWGKHNILWSLAGSSGHKVWPHLDVVINWIIQNLPDTHVVLVGDEFCRILQSGWDGYSENGVFIEREINPRVHCKSGKWSIRESMAFAEVCDLIIGTETGLLNAAGSSDVPKIVTLSHSSEEMLTKHWRNYIALNQPQGVGCNKHPCRMLHGASGHNPWLECPQEPTTGTALCQFHIGPEMMIDAIKTVWARKREAA